MKRDGSLADRYRVGATWGWHPVLDRREQSARDEKIITDPAIRKVLDDLQREAEDLMNSKWDGGYWW